MNKVILIGNISNDLEVKYTSNQKAVLRFSVALNRGKDKDGNDLGTDFVPCEAWGKMAENIERYFHKGSKIAITGRIQIDTYEKDEQKKSFTKVVLEGFEFLDKAEKKPGGYSDTTPKGFSEISEDIPF